MRFILKSSNQIRKENVQSLLVINGSTDIYNKEKYTKNMCFLEV